MTDSQEEPINLVPLLRRTFAWDVLPCEYVGQFFPCLDLVPGSTEGHQAEHEAKHDRLNKLAPIKNYLEVYSILASEIITKVMIRYDIEENRELVDRTGALKLLQEQNADIIRTALFSSVAQMLDNGVVTLGKAVQ